MAAKHYIAVVLTLAFCIGYSQQLYARKCHRRRNLFFAPEHCAFDLRTPRCVEGLISIQWVKHENENCNFGCAQTCCISIDGYASDAIRQAVIRECNYKEYCNLTSITWGTATIGYKCIDKTSTTIRTAPQSTASTTRTTTEKKAIGRTTANNTATTPEYDWATRTPTNVSRLDDKNSTAIGTTPKSTALTTTTTAERRAIGRTTANNTATTPEYEWVTRTPTNVSRLDDKNSTTIRTTSQSTASTMGTTTERKTIETTTANNAAKVSTTPEYVWATRTSTNVARLDVSATDDAADFNMATVVVAAIGGTVALVSTCVLVCFLLKRYSCTIQRRSTDSNTEMGDRSPGVTTQNTTEHRMSHDDITVNADNVAMYEGMVRQSTQEHVYSGIQQQGEDDQATGGVALYEGMVRPSTPEHVYSGIQPQENPELYENF